jgi:Protein involved in initiation of plasmid replication
MENKKLILAQDNVITKARYKFDLIEKRCIYQIIYTVRKDYIETNRGNRDLFENLIVTLTPAQLDECISGRDNRTKVYNSLKSLNRKQMTFENSEEWYVCNFINYAKHIKKSNAYEVEVSKLILPYLVELAANFTTLDLTVALTFASRYTQRFYEFCCMYRNRQTNYFFLDMEELRNMLGLKDKYSRFYDFKNRVLDVAQKEMKQSYDDGVADIYFTWKENDKIEDRIDFYLHLKQTEEQAKIDYNIITMTINSLITTLESFFPRDKKFIKGVKSELMLKPQLAIEVKDKIDKKILDYPRKEIPAILRYVLREDYGIS